MSEDKDYISREEALSYPFANGKYDKKNASMEFIFGCEAYKEWLETLPSVKDIRPKGHWVQGGVFYYCSECQNQEYVDYFSFCRCCGADMR